MYNKHITITVNKDIFERAIEAASKDPQYSDVFEHFNLIQIGETPDEALKIDAWREEKFPEFTPFIEDRASCMEAYAKDLWYQSFVNLKNNEYQKAHKHILQAIRIYEYIIRENLLPSYYNDLQHYCRSFRDQLKKIEDILEIVEHPNEQMAYAQVLKLLPYGISCRRAVWAEGKQIISRATDDNENHRTGLVIDCWYSSPGNKLEWQVLPNWQPSIEDILARDWMKCEEDEK